MSENEQSARPPVVTPARVIAAICVVAPFVAVLWVPIYDKDKPEVAGFPFFFWWQLLWVAITAGLMGLAYYVVRREELVRKGVTKPTLAETLSAQAPAADNVDDTEDTAKDTAQDTTEDIQDTQDTDTTDEGDAP